MGEGGGGDRKQNVSTDEEKGDIHIRWWGEFFVFAWELQVTNDHVTQISLKGKLCLLQWYNNILTPVVSILSAFINGED